MKETHLSLLFINKTPLRPRSHSLGSAQKEKRNKQMLDLGGEGGGGVDLGYNHLWDA